MHTNFYIAGPSLYQETFGLAPAHLQPGQRFVHRPGVTVSQQDNVDEALDTVNSAMIHYDARYAQQTTWKQPLMVSTVTLQRLIGMTTKTFGRRRRIVRFSSLAMTRPVFGGDTLYAETEVLAVDGAIASLRTTGLNQRDEVVAQIEWQAELDAALLPPNPALEPRFASHRQREDGAWVEQVGLFFEDLREGETFIHWPRRSLTAHEAQRQALRSLEISPQFHDLDLAASLSHPDPEVPQTWVLSVVTALTTRTFGRVNANLGWVDVEFGAEVRSGDTLEARSTIRQARGSASRPNEGIATVDTEALNQRGERVLSYTRTLLVYRRDADNPYRAAGY
jgi:itaconyl-CoA hydratase